MGGGPLRVPRGPRIARLDALRGLAMRLDGGVPFLLRPGPLPALIGAELPRAIRSGPAPAHRDRQPVPVLCRPRPGRRAARWPGRAAFLAALGAGGGGGAAGQCRVVPGVSRQLHLLRCAARHCGDAGAGAVECRRWFVALAVGGAGHRCAVGGRAPAAGQRAGGGVHARALNWLGLITRKPVTEDYVPLLPWLGVVWWGGCRALAAGQAAAMAGGQPGGARPGAGGAGPAPTGCPPTVLMGVLAAVAWGLGSPLRT